MKYFTLLASLTLMASGCGILIGRVRPVDERSRAYHFEDLSTNNSDWMKLDSAKEEGPDAEEVISDVAFQSTKTASIISLTSSCRAKNETEPKPLEQITDSLFIGISELEARESLQSKISGFPALITTVIGKLNNKSVKIQAAVLRHERCVFDIMLIAKPSSFETDLLVFSNFLSTVEVGGTEQ